MNEVAFFDFDGTLTKKDSFLAFLKFTHGWLYPFYLAVLSPIILLYKLKVLSNSKSKELVFSFFYRGTTAAEFTSTCHRFCSEVLPQLIRQEAYERLLWHKSQQHEIIIVTATFEEVIGPWVSKEGLKIIGTQLAYKNNKLTGKFISKNCYGKEKVNRISHLLPSNRISYAYGDSRGDKELLESVTYSYYRKFS
ncbi:MAG: HAD-IB family hydrolase [Cytophagaceae bacterium]|jgi:HAD superfamily hydrolase (TIGR01490 family)|nr:HAD-IB family hydrolase [Cytophagaceae bacterium]